MAESPGLDTLTATLFSRLSYLGNFDRNFRQALGQSLGATGLWGIVAHLALRGTTIGFFDGRLRNHPGLQRDIMARLTHAWHEIGVAARTVEFPLENGLRGFAVRMPEEDDSNSAGPDGTHGDPADGWNHCAAIYKPSAAQPQLVQHHASSTLLMLLDVVRQRERRFASFPGKVSERYWNDCRDHRDPRAGGLRPPSDGGMQYTATLAFDLRRSTFCMEQASDLREFGAWVDELVQILTAIAHRHGGVFDKFTGDGALVHFLKEECKQVYGVLRPVDAAMGCAIDMKRGLQIHLDHLMPLLHFRSRKVGAGIAIAVGDAFWSFDYRDNVIAVGESVVRACRVCDTASAGMVRLTNSAYYELSQDIRDRVGEWRMVDFQSKEIAKDMDVMVWECDVPGYPPKEIADLCASIRERSRRRRSRQHDIAAPERSQTRRSAARANAERGEVTGRPDDAAAMPPAGESPPPPPPHTSAPHADRT